MQQQLTGIGFDTKGVDGLIGPNSKQALSAFQKAKGRSKSNNGILTILDLRDLGFF
ncbi:MAG: peptidoglycan-binding domain-containing protein [Alphaproteobacteria bacterium]